MAHIRCVGSSSYSSPSHKMFCRSPVSFSNTLSSSFPPSRCLLLCPSNYLSVRQSVCLSVSPSLSPPSLVMPITFIYTHTSIDSRVRISALCTLTCLFAWKRERERHGLTNHSNVPTRGRAGSRVFWRTSDR